MANLGDFLKSNYQIGNIIAGFPALLDQYIAIEGNSVTDITSAGNMVIGKAQQLVLWKIQRKSEKDGGGNFNYNPASVIDAFVPGRYGKASMVTNPNKKDDNYGENFYIPRITAKKKIETIFPALADTEARDIIRGGIYNKEQFFYIKYMHPTLQGTWNVLKLKASIGHQKLVDTFSNTWTGHSAYGRTQKNYIYSETERTLPLSFFEYAYSKSELSDLYRRLNHLARINYGYYENANGVSNSLKAGTVVYLTIGNLYRDMPAIINRMTFEFDEDLWDMENFVPMMVKISINFTLLHYTNPDNTSDFYYVGVNPPAIDNYVVKSESTNQTSVDNNLNDAPTRKSIIGTEP